MRDLARALTPQLVERVAALLAGADSVLIAAGAGMSADHVRTPVGV